MFTRSHHLSIFWGRLIQFTRFHPIPFMPILILSSRPRLDLPSGVFPSDFPHQIQYVFLYHTYYMPSPSHPLRFEHLNKNRRFCFPGVTTHCGCIFTARKWALASSVSRFLDHTQRRATVSRTPLYEWSIRRRDLYLTTHNTHDKHPCPGGIQTHNFSRRSAEDLPLRPRSHWDQHM